MSYSHRWVKFGPVTGTITIIDENGVNMVSDAITIESKDPEERGLKQTLKRELAKAGLALLSSKAPQASAQSTLQAPPLEVDEDY